MGLRIVLIDDSAEFVETARRLLEREGLEVVGTAANGIDGIDLHRRLSPDATLVDIDLGDESGFDVVRAIVDGRPDSGRRVILISSHSREDFADLVEESPAAGFLSKSRLSAEAIRAMIGSAPDTAPA
jgi:DNA-binding NarL/FixJ family response regulator